MGSKLKEGGGGPAGSVPHRSRHGLQVVDSLGHRWTDEAERLFLDALGASANVTRAARVSGFSTNAIYSRRRLDPGFAARWQSALAQGYARVEMALLRRAEEGAAGAAPDPSIPLPAMTVSEALTLLKMHQASVTGEGIQRGKRARVRSLDEVHRSIIAKLDAFEAMRRAEAESGPGAGDA